MVGRSGVFCISSSFLAIMAPVDLNKNKDAILKAHKEVSDPKSETNW